MPTTKSAKKRLRQNEKRRRVNRDVKSRLKTLKKKVISASESGDGEALNHSMKECFSAIDKAARKRVLHKNKAAREKSRLSAAARKRRAG